MRPAFAPALARPAPSAAPAPRSRGAPAGLPRFMAVPLGAGAPLAATVRPALERSFGADLGGVRVHTELAASRAADAVGARAFAYGGDIVLSARASAHDLGLMAHETAHVLQQRAGGARLQAEGGAPGSAFEREAEHASAAVRRGERFHVALRTGGAYPQFGFWSTLTAGIGGLVDRAVGFIRDHARSIPGYDLLAVAIGRDPLTQQPVERSAANVIRGLVGLVPGGAALYDNLARAGVVPRAADWAEGELRRLNLTWERVRATISGFIGSLGVGDLADLGGVLARAVRMFGPLVRDIVAFGAGAAARLFEFIFEGALALAGSAGQQVLAVLRRAGAAVRLIIEDPVGFLRNLLAAVFGGFRQFGANIVAHLKHALFEWLFGALADAGIVLPRRFDLPGIISLVLQVLGLTWRNLRGRLVRVLGEPVVAGLETTFEFVKLLVTQGIGAAWRKVLEFAAGIADTVIAGIRSWVISTIVGQALVRLATMANPVGAIIQAVMAIYNTVMFVIERARQLMAFVSAVTDSIANIAAGRLSAAINYVEQTLARILPLVLSFLARFIGLGGISAKIREVITRIRAPVDRAIDRIVDWVAAQARNLASRALGGNPNAPAAERVQAGLAQGVALVNRHAGRRVGAVVLRPLLLPVKLRLRLSQLEVVPQGRVWAVRAAASPAVIAVTTAVAEDDQADGSTPDKALPLTWPKPPAASYRKLWFLPRAAVSAPMRQADIQKTPGAQQLSPTARTQLPGGGNVIGLTDKYQTRVGLVVGPKVTGEHARPVVKAFNADLARHGYDRGEEPTDGDHVVELQMSGVDDYVNLWPLNSPQNRSGGSRLKNMEVTVPDGTKKKVGDLPGKYFKIAGFDF